MNAYDGGRMVEARGMARLIPFLEEQSGGRLVLTDKGRLGPMLQQIVGDVLFNSRESGKVFGVEVKVEERWTGNLFLEVWSNRNLDNRDSHARLGSNPGWMLKLQSDLLFYYFLDADRLVVLDVFALKRWAFGRDGQGGHIHEHRQAVQTKRAQMNSTVGHVVPVKTLIDEMETRVRVLNVAQLDMLSGNTPFDGEAA